MTAPVSFPAKDSGTRAVTTLLLPVYIVFVIVPANMSETWRLKVNIYVQGLVGYIPPKIFSLIFINNGITRI